MTDSMHVPLHCLTADLILSQTEGHCFGTRTLLLHAFNHLFGGVIEPTWYASLDSIRYDSILSFIMWWKKDVQQSALPGSSAKGEDQKFLKKKPKVIRIELGVGLSHVMHCEAKKTPSIE